MLKIASINLSQSNFSIMPFQRRRLTSTAASVRLVDVIFIPFIVYYAYVVI
jgi:hypothetical protein